MSCKILAKLLQLMIQLLMVEVINTNQIAFVPLQFILNNVLVSYKTIHWTKKSKQSLIYLKLDFTKAYNNVNWEFLFVIMHRMEVDLFFLSLAKMLFQQALASINIKVQYSKELLVSKGI